MPELPSSSLHRPSQPGTRRPHIRTGHIRVNSAVSFRVIAKRADKSPTTVSTAFGGSLNALYSALMDRLEGKGQFVPEVIRNNARAHAQIAAQSSDPHRLWRLELNQLPRDAIGRRREIYDAAEGQPLRRAQAAHAMADAYLTRPDGAALALRYAEEGLNVCQDARHDAELHTTGIQCARIAADAARYLARQSPDAVMLNLYKIQQFKQAEAPYAAVLRLPVIETMAQFHAARAEALILDDVDKEIRAVRQVVAALKSHHDAGRAIPDDVISTVISRVCALQMAFPDHDHGADLETDRKTLLRLFRREQSAAHHAARSLCGVVRYTPGVTDAKWAPSAVDLLVATGFGVVGQLSAARYLLHLADVKKPDDAAPGVNVDGDRDAPRQFASLGKGLDRTSADLRAGTRGFLGNVLAGTMSRGSASVLLREAHQRLAELESADHDAATTSLPTQHIDEVLDSADKLVMSVLIGVRLQRSDIGRIVRELGPIVRYLVTPGSDAASYMQRASSENTGIRLDPHL